MAEVYDKDGKLYLKLTKVEIQNSHLIEVGTPKGELLKWKDKNGIWHSTSLGDELLGLGFSDERSILLMQKTEDK